MDRVTTAALQTDDALRAAIVLGVSALDHFVHEFVRSEMLEILRGNRSTCPGFLRFSLPMSAFRAAQGAEDEEWLSEEIRTAHGWQSFQDPDRIGDALKSVTEKKVWHEIGDELALTPEQAKVRLKAIVDRRNKIAHEADMNPLVPGEQWPITVDLVREALGYLRSLGESIQVRI